MRRAIRRAAGRSAKTMRGTSSSMWLSARFKPLSEAELPLPIEIRPIRNARRLRLRFDEAEGVLKLTCPWRISRRAALSWALDQKEWIEAQLARALPPEPFVPGATIPLEGSDVRLVWSVSAPRSAEIADATLRCGGPAAAFPRRIETYLKRRALYV